MLMLYVGMYSFYESRWSVSSQSIIMDANLIRWDTNTAARLAYKSNETRCTAKCLCKSWTDYVIFNVVHAERPSTSFMGASGGGLSEGYGHDGPAVCLGDGQMETYLKDMDMTGLASVWAMARRKPI